MLLSRKEKEERVIRLAEEGKTRREIAKDVHISLKTIGEILNKVTGDNVFQEELEKQAKMKKLSPFAKSLTMFKDKRDLADVAIELDLDSDTVLSYHADYLSLVRRGDLVKIHNELKGDLPLFLHLFRRMKKEGLNKEDITQLLEWQYLLKDLEKRVDLYNNHIWGLHSKKQQMEKEIGKMADALR